MYRGRLKPEVQRGAASRPAGTGGAVDPIPTGTCRCRSGIYPRSPTLAVCVRYRDANSSSDALWWSTSAASPNPRWKQFMTVLGRSVVFAGGRSRPTSGEWAAVPAWSRLKRRGWPEVELDGQVAFVTGGANGIGRAIADAFVGAGARVVVLDAAALADNSTKSTLVIRGDVRTSRDVERAMQAGIKRWGRTDFLVNDAAIYPAAYLLSEPLEEVMDVLDVNVLGPLRTIRAFVAAQVGQQTGVLRIVNITSTSASFPDARSGAYSVSKAALQSLTQVMALELAPGFTVNAVAPGYIDVRSITSVNRDRVSDSRRRELVQRSPLAAPVSPNMSLLRRCTSAAHRRHT